MAQYVNVLAEELTDTDAEIAECSPNSFAASFTAEELTDTDTEIAECSPNSFAASFLA